jgi:hypothetical protein
MRRKTKNGKLTEKPMILFVVFFFLLFEGMVLKWFKNLYWIHEQDFG